MTKTSRPMNLGE